MEYFSINANNVNTVKSIYVNDDNKNKLTKLSALCFSKFLEELDLSDCSNLKGVLSISKCKNLKKLKITKAYFKDISNIYKCTKLEELYLDLQFINYINLESINIFSNMQYLELHNIYININNFISFDNGNFIFNDKYLDFPNLHTLILNQISFNINDMICYYYLDNERIFEYIFEILSHCNNLKILKINFTFSGNKKVNFDNLKYINKLPLLEELELTDCKIKTISNLSKLKNLKKITISRDSVQKEYNLNNIEVNII